MSLVLHHRIDDPGSAVVRRRVVEHGGRRVPALWDGERLHEGEGAALAVLETLR